MRKMEPGINWIWYITDTREEAEKWFEEITGSKPEYDSTIFKHREGTWAFRLHR